MATTTTSPTRISINVDPKEHRMLKTYAAARYHSLKEFALQAMREKIAKETGRVPNAETRKALEDSQKKKNLQKYNSVEELFSDLGL